MERKTGFRRSCSAPFRSPCPGRQRPWPEPVSVPCTALCPSCSLFVEGTGWFSRRSLCSCARVWVRVHGCVFSPPLGGAVSSVALPFVPPVRWKPDRVAGPGSGLVTWRRCSGCRAPSWPRRQWAGGGVFPRCHRRLPPRPLASLGSSCGFPFCFHSP